MSSKLRTSEALIAAGLLLAAILAVFQPALGAGFVNWDDHQTVVDNSHIRGLGAGNLSWMFTTTYMGPYQPLSWMSLALDHARANNEPAAYHWTSVLLHAAAAFTLFLLAWRLLEWFPSISTSRSLRLGSALLAALLFALHPLRCESVCWVTERRDVLNGPLCFLAVYFWLGWTRTDHTGRRAQYVLALVCFTLALLAKATGMTLPLVLLALDVWPLQRWVPLGLRRLIVEKLPFAALSLVIAVVAVVGQSDANALLTWQQHTLAERTVVVLNALVFYPWKTLVPLGLYPYYRMPTDAELMSARYILPAIATVAISIGSWIFRRRAPAVWWAWCIYVVILLPVSGILQAGSQIAADRYTYLSLVPLTLLAAGGAAWIVSRRPAAHWIVCGASVLACVALGCLAHAQARTWRDSEALWSHVLRIDPLSPTANENLGDLMIQRGQASRDKGQAIEAFESGRTYSSKAVQLAPHPRRYLNLAVAEWLLAEAQPERRGELAAAATQSLLAGADLAQRARRPVPPLHHLLLAKALRATGRGKEAIPYAQSAIEGAPGDVGARRLLGELLLEVGDPNAKAVLEAAAIMAPNDGSVTLRLAQALSVAGDKSRALTTARRARELLEALAAPTAEELSCRIEARALVQSLSN